MASQRMKKSGLLYRTCRRNRMRRFRDLQWLQEEDEQPSQPALAGPSDQALPYSFDNAAESVEEPDCFRTGSDSEVSFEDSESSDADTSDAEDEPVPDRPYGETTLKDSLRLWALQTGQTRASVNLLLATLRQHHPEDDLPKDARTLLGTPVGITAELADVGGGQQCAECLQSYFRYYQIDEDCLMLNFFMDGLPLHDSTRTQFWPVLMKVCNVPDIPVMTMSIFCGEAKPSSAEAYLRPFVTELNELQENGLKIGTRFYNEDFHAIIADTPARSFCKGVVSHNSFHGCMKCTIVGVRINRRTVFPYEATSEPRTDALFRAGMYPLHIKHTTPLTDLDNCDMIDDVLSAEQMHLFDKGVQAKLMFMWTHDFLGNENKLTEEQQRKVSVHWCSLAMPSDYRRRPRDLKYLKLWKASEFKMFLLVAGPVVLKGRLPEPVYDHFMLLFVAVSLLTTLHHREQWIEAHNLLHQFVEGFATVYSPALVNSNVHNLLHVSEDVYRHGELSAISAYPFESKLHDIKKLVRPGRLSLAQAANRLRELQPVQFATKPRDPAAYESVRESGTDVITTIRRGFFVRRNFRDQWFLTTAGNLVRYERATKTGGNMTLEGHVIARQAPAFARPYSAARLNMYCASMRDLDTGSLRSFGPAQILCKVAPVHFENGVDHMFVLLSLSYPPAPDSSV